MTNTANNRATFLLKSVEDISGADVSTSVKVENPVESPVAEKALAIRTCNADMTSWGGFTWPESGEVVAPDWNPEPVCGGGLHMLLDGWGDWSLMSSAADAKWLIVEVVRSECVAIGEKVKALDKNGKVVKV